MFENSWKNTNIQQSLEYETVRDTNSTCTIIHKLYVTSESRSFWSWPANIEHYSVYMCLAASTKSPIWILTVTVTFITKTEKRFSTRYFTMNLPCLSLIILFVYMFILIIIFATPKNRPPLPCPPFHPSSWHLRLHTMGAKYCSQ